MADEHHKRHRILVVEDDPDSAEVICAILGELGHDCRAVSSGGAAVHEAVAFDPDIAIVDIGLPDLSGYEVARALRALERAHGLHLAALTGWGRPEDRRRATAAGFDQHVVKPTGVAALQHLVAVADGG